VPDVEADYVVVGGGSAGCVLAGRLTEDPSRRVLLLEAGPPDDKLAIRVPLAFGRLFGTQYDWAYTTVPQKDLGGRALPWPRGRTLGGSSSINAQVYLRGHRQDFDEWAALGNVGWSYDEVLPYFKRAERNERAPSPWHGGEGPMNVADLRHPSPLTKAFVQACTVSGFVATDDLNEPEPDGVGIVQVTQRRGLRWSAADAYLKPARRRPNLTVVTDAQVTRIRFEGRRATGVDYRTTAGHRTALAAREVILCGGVVNSPQLLMLSGVGPSEHLRSHGIEVVHDLPGVGANVQDHVIALVIVLAPESISFAAASSLRSALQFLLFRSGPLTSNASEACAFLRTDPALEAPDLELLFTPASSLRKALPSARSVVGLRAREVRRWLRRSPRPERRHAVAIAATLLKPRSVGVIRLAGSDGSVAPIIDPGYLSDLAGDDLRLLVKGVKVALDVARAGGFEPAPTTKLNDGSFAAGPKPADDVADFVRRQTHSLNHPVGSCKMGIDPMAVVDPELRVHGCQGLRVVDASIMPTIGRGHMNAPTIMIAEKAADLILAASRLPPHVPSEA
jgi:choline dehydrogenase